MFRVISRPVRKGVGTNAFQNGARIRHKNPLYEHPFSLFWNSCRERVKMAQSLEHLHLKGENIYSRNNAKWSFTDLKWSIIVSIIGPRDTGPLTNNEC